jgi:[glutamine synthetase] adenylyltransferase / [glutamine synthetase]-adenylyl-L-tyrosine phosphorylase
VTDGRASTLAGRLARLGFADVPRAEAQLAGAPLAGLGGDEAVLEALGAAASPDLALDGLARTLDALPASERGALGAAVRDDPVLRERLLGVLGTSAALGDHLARHPEHWLVLADPGLTTVRPTGQALRAELLAAVAEVDVAHAPDALRVAYRRLLLGLAARDMSGTLTVEDVAGELSDLAGATLDAALAVARAEAGDDAEPCRLAVIAMGKCGGRELNYVSDVDVVFVAEPVAGGDERAALATATRLAGGLMRVCSAQTAEGTIWPVDANLRPEGRSGALVRTLASHLAYYERWAQTWEFQALLKARPVAGDLELGRAYADAVAPLVWHAADRPNFVEDVRAMRRRVEESLPARDVDRELKLGPGGLRDVEFSVQLLQLVHGRSDVFVRSPTTLVALEQLSTHGYVGRTDAAELDHAYRFLRTLEHRLQLYRLRRTHVVPDDPADLWRVARSMGFRQDPAAELEKEWRRHGREVRRLHEKLFYRPLLNAVARLDPGEARLTPEAAEARLVALGYADPAGALRHLEALTSGVSRRAAIQRTLLPVLLGWFAESADPDAGLLGFRQVSDALGSTHWYLGLLRDAGAAAERLARVLASSRYATDLLLRAPDAVAMLADDDELVPRGRAAVVAEALATTSRHDDPGQAVAAVRGLRRRELFRTAVADLLGLVDVTAVGVALTDVTAATIAGALDAAVRGVESTRGTPLPTRVAVVAMGRFGGREVGYGSDADVVFVHDPFEGAEEAAATEAAHAVVGELRRLLAVPGPDPMLVVDADLRPEGRQGPLVRTLASYAAYYDRWSHVWESQALLRAAPVAGDPDLGERFVAMADRLRYPEVGLSDADVREIRRIKARVEAERMPRGVDPGRHTKLGPGGLADVEWTVQLLQLRHAGALPALRTTSTLAALEAAAAAQLVDADDALVLAEAWRLATRVRNAVVLVRGRPSDTLPTDTRELAGVARVLGYAAGHTGRLVEDYRRATRRARTVVERVFYR